MMGEVAAIGIEADQNLQPRQVYLMVGFGHSEMYVLSNLHQFSDHLLP